MPRKVKTAFSASEDDRAITLIHDVGFIPKVKDVDGEQVRGVEVRIGGGTSIQPRLAPTLYEFVELDNGDYLKVTEAALRIFDRQDWLRENRMRARIKVLVDKIGMDEFRKLVDEELEGDWVDARDFTIDHLLFVHDEEANAPGVPESYGTPNGDRSEFDAFVAENVKPQRQKGFVTVAVKVTRGDLTPEQFRGLAAIMREFSGGYARTTVQQNLVLRWVREESVYDVWPRLKELGSRRSRGVHDQGRRQLPWHRQLQARHHQLDGPEPGDRQAHRGDADHRSAHQADPDQDERLPERLRPAPHRDDRLLRRLHQGGRPHRSPPTSPMSGATGSTATSSTAIGSRPACPPSGCRTPSSAGSATTKPSATDGETFKQFVDRIGTEPFEELISDLKLPVEFNSENLLHFIDWNRSEPYKVERGEGECAV